MSEKKMVLHELSNKSVNFDETSFFKQNGVTCMNKYW